MTPARSCLAAALLTAMLTGPAGAAVPAASAPARATAPAARRAVPRAAATISKAARTTSVTRAHPPADTSVRTRPRVAPRTLDDIHIEGEIPVPQVLFITAREQRRLMEFQHHRYQRTSLELGRATATPARIVVTSPTPAERKEMQR